MRKVLILTILLVLGLSPSLQAQSGCCSSHGGVCGCRCCDGTALSDRCRPHFPCTGGGLTAPSRLSASAPSSTRVILTWVDNSSNETSFRIESSRDTEIVFQEIGFVGPNVTTATITNLLPSTTYLFRMRAQGTGGEYSPYSGVQAVTTPATPTCNAQAPCFANNRFKVEATWKRPDGASGNATVVQLTDDSGYLWFFAPSNVEAVFKVLNACGLNNSFWFFAGGLTNVQTEITVTDTQTGNQKIYTNPQNTPFKPIQDTAAFATCP
jgi:hypothetical protein